ncbi:MAG: recombinase family protein [Alphaproteobacteria bacterium]|nr:MAG: recombinase family protein [Alphaproteobacteria bacterium]
MKKTLRCAIYTRKSSEEGLEQEFNSLHAQREACEAYIKSQKHEGWKVLPDQYDDGGFSGGNIERPGLKQLLADIAAKRVDVVVVYKVDRLTRSLHDFAKIIDVFDKAGASFVSVTQQFNTTTSMGRLTLNVLLSFAQFEREVTGERIRDKIAASKAKGMWMGGMPPLGYKAVNKKLEPEPEEVRVIQFIFERYAQSRSIDVVRQELNESGFKTRKQRTGKWWHGPINSILRNKLYIGMIVHKDKEYPGEHKAIISNELWNKVHKVIEGNKVIQINERINSPSLLARIILDKNGHPLTPATSQKGAGLRYRYYITGLAYIDKKKGQKAIRVPAAEAEELVWREIGRLLDDTERLKELLGVKKIVSGAIESLVRQYSGVPAGQRYEFIRQVISKIYVSKEDVRFEVNNQGLSKLLNVAIEPNSPPASFAIKYRLTRRRNNIRIISENDNYRLDPTDAEIMKRTIVKAFAWQQMMFEEGKSVDEIGKEFGVSGRYVGKMIEMSFSDSKTITNIISAN